MSAAGDYRRQKEQLLRRARSATPLRVREDTPGLPVALLRYLQASRAAHLPAVRMAVLRQRGELRLAVDRPWVAFTSEQAYSLDPPGFVWLARAKVAPGIDMQAIDSFVEHRGRMLIRVFGLLPVVDARGPEIDQGAALRHWGEILSFPEAVLHPALRWEAIDERRCRLTVPEDRLTAVVEFGPDGFPSATHGDRYRDVKGRGVLTPWSGLCRDWKAFAGGRMFPSRWESVWRLTDGEFSAVRMETLEVVTDEQTLLA